METILRDVFGKTFQRCVVSNGTFENYHKIVVRPVVIKQKQLYQLEQYTKTQVFHENLTKEEAVLYLSEVLSCMKQMDVFSDDMCTSYKISKKGKVLTNSHKLLNVKAVPVTNNRKKKYILEEGIVIDALVDLGVMTKEGNIVVSKTDKFRQINRFVEMVDDVLEYLPQTLHVIDFGCGKSYLTFVLYHYLTVVKQRTVTMVGLDLKEDVIRHCNAIKDRYGYEGLSFETGDIHGYHPSFTPDLVISLHACDTATDYALANAISWNTKVILSVPCCQKEVNHSIKEDTPLLDYGIIKERYSALVTDTLRAKIVEAVGYRVQILEFIDIQHSPKNLLLRCVKIKNPDKPEVPEEILNWIDGMRLHPTLLSELKRMNIL
ncbi:MAG: SAM-dependent methyltransferase [Erysipelotrichaceae bacterium]|nr:SAM-dependent methyltransferase [Erysipelotrichaceae bacterium]